MEKANQTDFPVKLSLRIDWSELDYFGHVNNVHFFKYIQSSRVHYWDQIGLRESHLKTNIGPMLASSECSFRKPLFYPGKISLLSRVVYIKNTSFSIQHQIIDDKGDIAAEAQDVMVMFDFNKNEKVKFPAALKAKIESIEKRKF